MQHVVGAGVLVLVQHLLERPSAVGRAEDAALGVRAVRVAEHGDEQPVGVARIDGDRRDHLAVAQAEVLSTSSGVGGLVDAVADREIGADDAGAGADVDDVRVRRRDGDRADRAGRLVVEQRHPVGAVVGRAPDAAVVEADVEDVRLAGDAGQRAGASGARRADVAPAHLAEREVLGGGGRRAGAASVAARAARIRRARMGRSMPRLTIVTSPFAARHPDHPARHDAAEAKSGSGCWGTDERRDWARR